MPDTQKPHFNPVVLIILDGVGIAPNTDGNAVTKAKTPFLERVWDAYPHTLLQASGEHVGLPPGIKGNSEVGHMNLGSGRIIYQELPRINRAIMSGAFFTNQVLNQAFEHAEKHKSKLHVAVCFSDAGVHGTIEHLKTFLQLAQKLDFSQPLIIHAFTDGRDSPPKSSTKYFKQIDGAIQQFGRGIYGSVTGRYFAMDRNQVWERVQRAYDLLISGIGTTTDSWQNAVGEAYIRGETDEFISPTLIKTPNGPDPTIKDNDAFVLLNYRADRAIELTASLILPEFNYFPRTTIPQNLYFAGMTEYAKDLPKNVAFPAEHISVPIGRLLAEHDMRQLRIAESEKFPHVTYFFNGGRSIKFDGEDRIEIPSPDVSTYDLKPEMCLPEVTQKLIEKLALRIYDFVIINIANGDMVGHTGSLEATKTAMEVADKSIEQITKAVNTLGGATIITADHGNAEEMINMETKDIDTEHSINPVPFIVVPSRKTTSRLTLSEGKLSDVTPTILSLLGMNKPSEMTGRDLCA